MQTLSILAITSSLILAAPVPKVEKATVELKLSAKNQQVLEITIQNNGTDPLKLEYYQSPLELVTVELRGSNGKKHTIPKFEDDDDLKLVPETLIIEAGKSKTLTLHSCHSLPQVGEPQTITFSARLKLDGKTIEAQPLTVER